MNMKKKIIWKFLMNLLDLRFNLLGIKFYFILGAIQFVSILKQKKSNDV